MNVLGYQVNCKNFKEYYSLINTLFLKSKKKKRQENKNDQTKKKKENIIKAKILFGHWLGPLFSSKTWELSL